MCFAGTHKHIDLTIDVSEKKFCHVMSVHNNILCRQTDEKVRIKFNRED